MVGRIEGNDDKTRLISLPEAAELLVFYNKTGDRVQFELLKALTFSG